MTEVRENSNGKQVACDACAHTAPEPLQGMTVGSGVFAYCEGFNALVSVCHLTMKDCPGKTG
jgi:hypothetical protein